MCNCKHDNKVYVFSSGKIPRYMSACSTCGAFIKWISNSKWEMIKDNVTIITEKERQELKNENRRM